MQVSTQQQPGGAARSADGTSTLTRGRRRIGAATIAALVACAVVTIAALVASRQGTSEIGAGASSTARATRTSISDAAATHTTVTWVDGLANGLILPSDVTSRLAARDPEAADAVLAAWSRLDQSGGAIRRDRTVGWVDGLAAGLILPSDVTSRLAAQDPEMADAVMAAWSDLDRSGDGIVRDTMETWVHGLATGLILPSDVTSRLAARDPQMAKAVMAAWAGLDSMGPAR
jgi:hypothetical protein